MTTEIMRPTNITIEGRKPKKVYITPLTDAYLKRIHDPIVILKPTNRGSITRNIPTPEGYFAFTPRGCKIRLFFEEQKEPNIWLIYPIKPLSWLRLKLIKYYQMVSATIKLSTKNLGSLLSITKTTKT